MQDFDIIGQGEPIVSDAVCMHVIHSALCDLGYDMKCVEIRVNHSKLLRGILSCCHVPAHLYSPLKSILRVSVCVECLAYCILYSKIY